MKIWVPILFLFFLVQGPAISFSQTKTKTTKPSIASLTEVPIQQSRLDSLYNVLHFAPSPASKADVCFLVSRYYANQLKIDSALYYSDLTRDYSFSGNYELGMAKYYLTRAHALYFRSTVEPGLIEKSIDILTRYKEATALMGFAYRIRARQYTLAKDIVNARKSYHSAIHYYTISGQSSQLQFICPELGRTFSHAFETDSAAYWITVALRLAEKNKDAPRIYIIASNLGELYHVAEDLPNAARYLGYAWNNRPSNLSPILERTVLHSYVMVLLQQNDFAKAEPLINEYASLNEKVHDQWGTVLLDKMRGTYHFFKGNYDEALKYLHSAYMTVRRISGDVDETKNIAYYLGRSEYSLGQYDSAIVHLSYAGRAGKQNLMASKIPNANYYVALSYEKLGDKDAALAWFRIYDHLKDSLNAINKEKAVIELRTKYETEKKEQQIQLLEREQEISAYQLRSQMDEIEKRKLLDAQQTQQLALLSQQNEISRLEASEKSLAYDNQQKEMVKKQKELALLTKENELQSAIAITEAQRNKFSYFAIAAILFFAGYVLYRYIQNRKLSRQLAASLANLKQAQEQLIKSEKEKEAENIRVRISRDIHDEVGATLSGVALFSEIAREKMKQHKNEDAQVYLEHITSNSKEMVDKMSDIVWAINPDNDSIERIVGKLQSYAFNLCAVKGITLHTCIDDTIRETYPSMQVKRNLYLFMKEAINNAVKYSNARNIFICLQKNNDEVVAEVRDDGKGFDNLHQHEGNGLKNMKARAKNLSGNLSIESQNGLGTRVSLAFNFHPAGGQAAEI